MPDCDYCDDTFDDEDAYLDHLAADHEGELGPIERRRVEERSDDGGGGSTVAVAAVVVGLVAVVALAVVFFTGGGGSDPAPGSDDVDLPGPENIESSALSFRGNSSFLEDVERFPSQGRGHVSPSQLDYSRIPPLSGPHLSRAASAGFYEETPNLGNLVHSLEHGAVIIYYERGALAPEVEQSLQQFVQAHTDPWTSVLVVPNPNDDPEAKFVVTAWQHRLYMDQYDPRTVYSFLSEFLGRGPENNANRGREPIDGG